MWLYLGGQGMGGGVALPAGKVVMHSIKRMVENGRLFLTFCDSGSNKGFRGSVPLFFLRHHRLHLPMYPHHPPLLARHAIEGHLAILPLDVDLNPAPRPQAFD